MVSDRLTRTEGLRNVFRYLKARFLAALYEKCQYPFHLLRQAVRLPLLVYALYVGTNLFQTTYDAKWKAFGTDYVQGLFTLPFHVVLGPEKEGYKIGSVVRVKMRNQYIVDLEIIRSRTPQLPGNTVTAVQKNLRVTQYE